MIFNVMGIAASLNYGFAMMRPTVMIKLMKINQNASRIHVSLHSLCVPKLRDVFLLPGFVTVKMIAEVMTSLMKSKIVVS